MAKEHKIRVMIVDDIIDTREQLAKLVFFVSDIEVVAMASDGRQAVQYATQYLPDVIIMDINMPVMDGIAATEVIMKTHPQIRIIIISVQGETDYLRRAMLAGAREFLTKPISAEDFYKSIRYVFYYHSIDRRRISLLNASRQASDFYEILSKACKRPKSMLLYIETSRVKHNIEGLINEKVLDLGLNRSTILLGHKGAAVIIDTADPEMAVNQIIDTFYAHPLITANSEAILLFGMASGLHDTASDMIEATAENFLERRDSQGVLEHHEPYILALEPERELLRHRYYQLMGHYRALQDQQYHANVDEERIIRARIEQFTAIVGHDIGSSFNALQGAVSQAMALPSLPETLQKKLLWTNQQIILCTVWQHSLISLGEGRTLQLRGIDLYSWFVEHLRLLHKHLNLAFELKIVPCQESVQSDVDTSLLLVACLHLIIMAQASGAGEMQVEFHSNINNNKNVMLIGFYGDRSQLPKKLSNSALLPYHSLYLISSVLQRQRANIKWGVIRGNYCAYISFLRSGSKASHVLFRRDLQHEIEQLENEIARLNSKRPLKAKRQVSDNQVAKILIPHVTRLETEIQKLTESLSISRSIPGSGIIISFLRRAHSLAQYSYLLVRNLELALHGVRLSPEQININEQIREVLDMLEHKLNHLICTIRLIEPLPLVTIASVEAKQILLNIIKNAAEATPTGGELIIETLVCNRFLCVSISDNGSGIPIEHRDHIFQLHFSTKGKGGNSGVGLYTVQTILDRYGGQIQLLSARYNADGTLSQWIRGSSLGKMSTLNSPGTVFRIGFPLSEQFS